MATTGMPAVGRLLDGRHDAVDVDGDDDEAVDLLLDVGLDRAVLRGGIVVGVEDHELGARGVGRLLGALVHLVEEQRLLVDLHQREGLLVLRLRAAATSAAARAVRRAAIVVRLRLILRVMV